jgi:hypothetical protein
VVEQYRQIGNLSAYCDRVLARHHKGRYAHLPDHLFWPAFRDTLHQWASDDARPSTKLVSFARGIRPWLYKTTPRS